MPHSILFPSKYISITLFSGICWFHGPWFVGPADTQHLPTRMFHDKEVFLSSLEETTPLMNVTGKCCVQPIREYCRCTLLFLCLRFCILYIHQDNMVVHPPRGFGACPGEIRLRAVPPFPSCDRVQSAEAQAAQRTWREERKSPSPLLPLVPFSARPVLPRSVHDHRRKKEGLLAVYGEISVVCLGFRSQQKTYTDKTLILH